MVQNYPAKFDEVFGWECCTDAYKPTSGDIDGCLQVNPNGYTRQDIEAWNLMKNFVAPRENPNTTPPTISLHEFFKAHNVTDDDFVVVKMVGDLALILVLPSTPHCSRVVVLASFLTLVVWWWWWCGVV